MEINPNALSGLQQPEKALFLVFYHNNNMATFQLVWTWVSDWLPESFLHSQK